MAATNIDLLRKRLADIMIFICIDLTSRNVIFYFCYNIVNYLSLYILFIKTFKQWNEY